MTGVLLLAHGSPDSLDEMAEFLKNVRNGSPAPPELVAEMQHRYGLIGGRSPLREITELQAQGLAKSLGEGWRVYIGMRNWTPYIQEAVNEIARDKIDRLICLCLAPQNSTLSVGLYRKRLKMAEAQAGIDIPVHFIESWHKHPLLLRAFADLLKAKMAALEGQKYAVIFTAHSLPTRVLAAGDLYHEQVRETAEAVVEMAKPARWRFAYQSQGANREPWLLPSVENTMLELHREGFPTLVIAPIGFVSDHVEVLYDIDIAFQEFAQQLGVQLLRTESLNDRPEFIAAMAAVVRESAEQTWLE